MRNEKIRIQIFGPGVERFNLETTIYVNRYQAEILVEKKALTLRTMTYSDTLKFAEKSLAFQLADTLMFGMVTHFALYKNKNNEVEKWH